MSDMASEPASRLGPDMKKAAFAAFFMSGFQTAGCQAEFRWPPLATCLSLSSHFLMRWASPPGVEKDNDDFSFRDAGLHDQATSGFVDVAGF